MMPAVAYWNPVREAMLRSLWAQGKTASQMSLLMPFGPTRNTIIGKLARLKLTLHPSRIIAVRNKHTRSKDGAIGRNLRYGAAQVYQPFKGSGGAWEALEGSNPIALVDHVEGCRWPIGEDRPFKFCGLPVDGRHYCETHLARAVKHP